MGIVYPELLLQDFWATSFLQHTLNSYDKAGCRRN